MLQIKTVAVLLLFCGVSFGRARISGYCEQGGQVSVTNSVQSSNKLQQSYPRCTLTVYYTYGAQGTLNINGTSASLVTGPAFGNWAGLTILINNVPYTVSSVSSPTQLTLTGAAGVRTNVPYVMSTPTPAPLYSDNNSTPQAYIFTASSTGYWGFYADDGTYDVQMSGGGIPAPFTWGAVSAFDPLAVHIFPGVVINGTTTLNGPLTTVGPNLLGGQTRMNAIVQNNIRYSSQFPGADCGEQINNAYADLPTFGGKIIVDTSCSFATPIIFGVNSKAATLEGFAGGAVTLTYTGTTGTAINLNYGTDLTMGKGIRDLTLTGPGHSTGTIGVVMGGSNGAQGTTISNSKIQGFGVGLQLANLTWICDVIQTMIRDNGINALFPTGLFGAGENMKFDHVTFADAPPPHTNSVWVQGGGEEIVFENCSFDQVQLRVGSGGSGAQVLVHGSHFENPNYAVPGSVDYTYVVVDRANSNYLRFSDNYILNDRVTAGNYAQFMQFEGGVVHITNFGMYSPTTLISVMTLFNAVNISLYGFNDQSGNAIELFGGSTTGNIVSFPNSGPGTTSGFNNILGAGDITGSAGMQFGTDVAVGTTPHNHNLTVNGQLTVNGAGNNVNAGGNVAVGPAGQFVMNGQPLALPGRLLRANQLELIASPVSGLPACPGPTSIRVVSDSNTNTWGAVVAGGGSFVVGVFCDGSSGWTVFAK